MEIQGKFATFLSCATDWRTYCTRNDFYEESGINPMECRGKCSDSAPKIQSENKRVANFILKESEKHRSYALLYA